MSILKKIASKATDFGGALTSLPSRNKAQSAKNGVEAIKYLRKYREEGSPTYGQTESEARNDKTTFQGARKAKMNLEDAKSNLGYKKVDSAQASLSEYKKTGKAGKY